MLLLSLCVLLASTGTPPLRQDAYVWQRSWTSPLRIALKEHGGSFSNMVVLNAEVTWKAEVPTTVMVSVDYKALAEAHARPGLALRIGPYAGRFSETNSSSRFVTALSVALIASARSNGLTPAEFQLDYDCPSSKLEDYVLLARTVRRALAPTPMIITALPTWLDQPSFKNLLHETDGFVLQVHSLQRPKDISSRYELCETNQVTRWVASASRLNTPFRVALPTYSFLLAFDSSGQFIGLSADGQQKVWPTGTRLKTIKTEPAAIAALIQNWLVRLPPFMEGVIWFRFPISTDSQNLTWASLESVMHGQAPRKECHAIATQRDRLIEISLVNSGDDEFRSAASVRIYWDAETSARPESFDALADFEPVNRGPSSLIFTSHKKEISIAPGQQRVIGWIRFRRTVEVKLDLSLE